MRIESKAVRMRNKCTENPRSDFDYNKKQRKKKSDVVNKRRSQRALRHTHIWPGKCVNLNVFIVFIRFKIKKKCISYFVFFFYIFLIEEHAQQSSTKNWKVNMSAHNIDQIKLKLVKIG